MSFEMWVSMYRITVGLCWISLEGKIPAYLFSKKLLIFEIIIHKEVNRLDNISREMLKVTLFISGAEQNISVIVKVDTTYCYSLLSLPHVPILYIIYPSFVIFL